MKRLVRAFFASMAAFRFGWQHETALRQEMIVFVLAIPAAFYLTSDLWKILLMLSAILLVMLVEFLNTGIEKLADRVTLEQDKLIGIAKDCGSAAVLIASVISSGIWAIAVWEYFAA
jgi:diacylglycerol kinase (ATP)